MYDFVVIGKGLFGSAAARYLSALTPHVAIVGPDEVRNTAVAPRVHASHYDQGRITGLLGRTPVWTHLAAWSIAQYRSLEAASGIDFFVPCGRLHVKPRCFTPAFVAELQAIGGADADTLSAAELAVRFPYLRFPPLGGIHEHAPAGYINPRALIRAQLAVSQQAGAHVVAETAVSTTTTSNVVKITTDSGRRLHARQVLVATGAFANCFDVLPRPLDLRVKSETIILAEVTPAAAARLADMPTIGYEIDSPTLEDIYMVPPTRYPDGRYYIKMGCNTVADQYFDTLKQMHAWMTGGSTAAVADDMRAALREMLPDLEVTRFQMGRCLVTYTAQRYPYIDAVVPGRVYAAVGGNGTGAHTSDAIGRAAAHFMARGEWPAELPRELFRARYLGEAAT